MVELEPLNINAVPHGTTHEEVVRRLGPPDGLWATKPNAEFRVDTMVGPVTHASVGYTEVCGLVQCHNREDWSNEENHTFCRSRCTPKDDCGRCGRTWFGACASVDDRAQ